MHNRIGSMEKKAEPRDCVRSQAQPSLQNNIPLHLPKDDYSLRFSHHLYYLTSHILLFATWRL
jgi:hypothetical protein